MLHLLNRAEKRDSSTPFSQHLYGKALSIDPSNRLIINQATSSQINTRYTSFLFSANEVLIHLSSRTSIFFPVWLIVFLDI